MNDIEFDNWNEVKKSTNNERILVGFKQRDIFNVKMGKNIGFEQKCDLATLIHTQNI